jgi:hypothetical protein
VGPPVESTHHHETATCVGGFLFMAACQAGAPGDGVCAGLCCGPQLAPALRHSVSLAGDACADRAGEGRVGAPCSWLAGGRARTCSSHSSPLSSHRVRSSRAVRGIVLIAMALNPDPAPPCAVGSPESDPRRQRGVHTLVEGGRQTLREPRGQCGLAFVYRLAALHTLRVGASAGWRGAFGDGETPLPMGVVGFGRGNPALPLTL